MSNATKKTLPQDEACPVCEGKGWWIGVQKAPQACLDCHGRGSLAACKEYDTIRQGTVSG